MTDAIVVDGFRQRAGKFIAKVFGLDDLFLTGQEHPAFLGFGGKRFTPFDVREAYAKSWIAYACISQMAEDISGVPLRIWRDPEDPESVIKEATHPLNRLIRSPAPGLSPEQFIQFLVVYLKLRGAFFVVFDDIRNPQMMLPTYDPLHWQPKLNDEDRLVAWRYRHRREMIFLPSEVIVHRLIAPDSPWGWQSPLESAADPLNVDRMADHLTGDMLEQGGQPPAEFTTDNDIGETKLEQLVDRIRNRTVAKGELPRPLILTMGLKRSEMKFTLKDLELIARQEKSAERIAAIYKMSPSLIWRNEMPNRETYKITVRRYWTNNLIPTINSIQAAFDIFTERFGGYLRFDLSDVEALHDDLQDRVGIAKILHDMHIPISVLNDRLELGLDVSRIPGADDVMVPLTWAPLSEQLAGFDGPYPAAKMAPGREHPEPQSGPSPPASSASGAAISRAEILRRHRDPLAVIARSKARTALEVRLAKGWRRVLIPWRAKAVKIAEKYGADVGGLGPALKALAGPMGDELVDLVAPIHLQAASEGVLSILDLTSEERWYGTEREIHWRDAPQLPAEAIEVISKRQNYIKLKLAPGLFDSMMEDVENAVIEEGGPTMVDVARIVRHRFNVVVNRAAMIGRTEVGTAYNVSRFTQMRVQGFDKHTWMTSSDEYVRGNDPDDFYNHISSNNETRNIGEVFPSRLHYPQEDGGDAGNVINCRCETIPEPGT